MPKEPYVNPQGSTEITVLWRDALMKLVKMLESGYLQNSQYSIEMDDLTLPVNKLLFLRMFALIWMKKFVKSCFSRKR